MAARNDSGVPALDLEGALRHPDISGFAGTVKGFVKCMVPGCGVKGEREGVWVFEHLAGHPYACPEEGCGRVFTRESMINRHMRAHGKLYDEVEGETEKERHWRMRMKRRDAYVEAGMTSAA